MEFATIIECEANDGTQNQFRYSLEESDEQGKVNWVFRVMPLDLNAVDYYEFSVVKINDNTGKIVAMDNRDMTEYRGKGITEKMIEVASDVLGITIISSTNKTKFKSLNPEWRTDEATKIWKRLLGKGAAVHDKEKDIYTFIKQRK